MSVTYETKSSGRPSYAWIISCAALCTAIIAYGLLVEKDISGGMAYQIGYNLPISAIAAGIFYLIFRHRESTRTGWLGFVLIYGAFIASAYFANVRQQAALKVAATEIGRALETLNQEGTESVADISAVPTASGDAGKMERLTKQIINRSLGQTRAYEAELEAIGWSGILDGQRIEKDKDLRGSMRILHDAHILVEKYRSKTDEMIDQNRRDIESSDMGLVMKRNLLNGYDRELKNGRENALKVWALEEQIISQVDSMFNFLSENRGEWEIENGQIVFYRQDVLDSYNTYFSRISELTNAQKEIQNSVLQRAQNSLRGASH